jgi:hypothetical protein
MSLFTQTGLSFGSLFHATGLRVSASLNLNPVPPPPHSGKVYPGPSWNGTEGSGWPGGAGEPVPSTPASRTGPMPIMMVMGPQYTVYTDDGWIGCFGLFNEVLGGMEKVTLAIEGRTFENFEMEARARTDARTGASVIEWAYWFQLDWTKFGMDGQFRCYFIGTPNDPAYQERVTAAQVFNRYATKYEVEYTVNSDNPTTSTNFPTLIAAMNALQTNNLQNRRWHVYVTKAGTYQFYKAINSTTASGWGDGTARKYWKVIEAAPGIDVTIGGTPGSRGPDWHYNINNLWLTRIDIDSKDIKTWYLEDINPWNFHMEGGGLVNSASGGRYALYQGNIYGGVIRDLNSANAQENLWLTDCHIRDITTGPKYANVRNNLYERMAGDTFSAMRNVYNATVDDVDCQVLRVGIGAMQVSYSGGLAATWRCSGNSGSSKLFTFTIGGTDYKVAVVSSLTPNAWSNTATYTSVGASVSYLGGLYYNNVAGNVGHLPTDTTWWTPAYNFPSTLGAAINALGVTGLLAAGYAGGAYDDSLLGVYLEKGTAGAVPNFGGFGATTLNATPQNLVTAIDAHGDLGQSSANNPNQNVAVVNVKATNMVAMQAIFMSNVQTGHQDFAYVNVMFDNLLNDGYNSQTGITPSAAVTKDHILLYYVHLPDQDLDIKGLTVPTQVNMTHSHFFGVVANDIYTAFGATTPAHTGIFAIHAPTVGPPPTPVPTLDVQSSQSRSALYVDYAGGDYRPKISGNLVTQAVAPVVPFDINGAARAGTSPLAPFSVAAA